MSEGSISRWIAHLFQGGQRSDLVVKTAMRTYRLHQIFLCTRSGNLRSLCKLEAADDGWLQGTLDLRGEHPEATDCMLQYLYKDDYCAPEPQAMTVVKGEKGSDMRRTIEAPLLHVKVYRLGEKYGLRSLQLSALDKFRASSSDLWHTEGFLEATRDVYVGAKGGTRAVATSLSACLPRAKRRCFGREVSVIYCWKRLHLHCIS